MTIRERIKAVLKDGPMTVKQIEARLPDLKPSSIGPTLSDGIGGHFNVDRQGRGGGHKPKLYSLKA